MLKLTTDVKQHMIINDTVNTLNMNKVFIHVFDFLYVKLFLNFCNAMATIVDMIKIKACLNVYESQIISAAWKNSKRHLKAPLRMLYMSILCEIDCFIE